MFMALAGSLAAQGTDSSSVVAARRLVSAVSLAAKEYRNGVPAAGGRITAPEEVAEARLFLDQAGHELAALPDSLARGVGPGLAVLRSALDRTSAPAPDSVAQWADAIVKRITAAYGGALDPYPAAPPSLARGRLVFQQQCVSCHGAAGKGDGPAGRGLKPPPANLADPAAMRTVSPLDTYRKITIGVAGTAMPRFDGTLSADDRWAVAAYVSTLRSDARTVHEGEGIYALECASCHGSGGAGDGALARSLSVRPPALRDLAVSGRFSDAELSGLIAHGRPGTPMPPFNRPTDSASLGRVVAFVRTLAMSEHPAGGSSAAVAAFASVRARLDSAVRHRSADEAFDAYLAFEQVETDVRARNAPLAGELEDEFANLRTRAAAGARPAELAGIHEQILAGLERAEREVADRDSRANLFFESLGITLREGFEAILIIGALMAFLAKAGAVERRRDVAWGAWLAVLASLATFAGVELLFEVTSNQREALEGWTMLLATAVLFYVSYWLLSKVEADKWNSFVRDRVKGALSSGSRWALAGVAFLAVYREGFETILFYKALLTSGSTGGAVAVVAGLGVGCAGLVLIYLAINLFGMRLPLRPFFAVTGGLLYYMAFVFAGKGVAELQNAGVVGMRPVDWGPRLPALGVYPTAQSLAAQGVLLALALVAVGWMVSRRPRPA